MSSDQTPENSYDSGLFTMEMYIHVCKYKCVCDLLMMTFIKYVSFSLLSFLEIAPAKFP